MEWSRVISGERRAPPSDRRSHHQSTAREREKEGSAGANFFQLCGVWRTERMRARRRGVEKKTSLFFASGCLLLLLLLS